MKKEHMQHPFVEAGMTDKETGIFPNFDRLIGTCKRWVSCNKDIGISKQLKMECKEQVSSLARIQIEEGGISYQDMIKHNIPRGESNNCTSHFMCRHDACSNCYCRY